MIEFITGAAGSGKSTEMIGKIDLCAEENKDICIIVPEQFSYEFDKNLYKKIGAQKFNSLLSLSFTGLARHIFQNYGDSKRSGKYADETSRMILIYQAIKNASENPQSNRHFERQAMRPGFAEEMLKLVGEMKQSGITPEKLREKSVLLDKNLMDKTSDIALIYLEFERLMSEYGFKDTFDDIKAAAVIANFNQYFKGKTVFIDEFESYTGAQLEFLRIVLSQADNTYITLRTDDVNAGEFTLFETVNSTYRSLVSICRDLNLSYTTSKCEGSYRFKNGDLAYLSENILRSKKVSPEKAPVPENIRIFEAKDYYSEAEYVCATIKRLISSNSSLKYSDIAVVSNNIEDYAEVLEASFERCGIPYFMSIEKPVMHASIMIFLSSLIDIITRKTFSSELIFRYIKCGFLNVSLTDEAILENYCYKWSIDGDIWNSGFKAEDIHLEKLESLRKFIIEPLNKLKKKLSRKCRANDFCRIIYNHLAECGAERSVSRLMGSMIKENRDYDAAELKRLWACLIDILDTVSETLGDCELTAAEAGRIIKSLIGRINYSVPPQKLDSVTAASARTARLSSPKIVFVMGANDGDFPNTVNLHGIFSESDKQQLSDCGIEISRRLPELIASERLVVYKAFSAASEKLYISYSLSDLTGQSKYSAPVVDSVIQMFGKKDMRITEANLRTDYYAVTMKSAFYHYMQRRKNNNSSVSAIKKLLFENSEYKRRLSYVLSRSEKKDIYKVSTDIMKKLKNFESFAISPTSFEKYNRCHFQYFCSDCLRLYSREKVELDVRSSGSIIHNCFYNVISSRSKEEFVQLPYNTLEKEISESAEEYLSTQMGGEFAKSPRFELGFKKLSQRLIKVMMHTQQELMASSFEPKAFEINLRQAEGGRSLRLPFSGGTLSFGGIIDRADSCIVNGEKYVRIIDYKSSGKDIDKYRLSGGVNMQMLLYLFAITENKGIYADSKPAGVLYSPVSISNVDSDDTRIATENTKEINSALKTSGLVLSDINVLEAMEHDVSGKYVPAKLNKFGDIDVKSSCITQDAFDELKKFTYQKLIDMAESVYNGDADANPLIFGEKDIPCNFCDYGSVCGNSSMARFRDGYEADTQAADEILSKKSVKKEAEENGMD